MYPGRLNLINADPLTLDVIIIIYLFIESLDITEFRWYGPELLCNRDQNIQEVTEYHRLLLRIQHTK